MRQGLRDCLSDQPGLEVGGEADSVADAAKQLAASRFDLVILDISFRNGASGLDLIKDMRARGDERKVLVYSIHDESLYAERVVRAGAQGYLSKEQPADEVLKAVRQVLNGEIYLSPRMSSMLLQRTLSTPAPIDDSNLLSDRELQVLELIGRGHSTSQIADQLCVSGKTIETHRQNMKKKLKLESGTQLIRYAVNWVETGEQGQNNG
jgi:DNA-binding NarL/FixJ family response regulator